MEFTEIEEELLLCQVAHYPELYDHTNRFYREKFICEQIWSGIGQKLEKKRKFYLLFYVFL